MKKISAIKNRENMKSYIILGISFLLMIFVGKLPSFGQMTAYGMELLGIFVGCIFWLGMWCERTGVFIGYRNGRGLG